MIGGLVGRPVANSTGPGRPMPTATMSPRRRPARRTKARPRSTIHASTFSGPTATSRSMTSSVTTLAARSVTARRTCGRADVGTEDEAGMRVEGEAGRRPPARRRRLAGRTDECARDEGVDALGHRRPPEARGGGELAARPRRTVTQQLQQRPGTAGAIGGTTLPHGRIEPHRLSIAPERLLLDNRQKSSRVDGSRRHAGDVSACNTLLRNRGQPGDAWHEQGG